MSDQNGGVFSCRNMCWIVGALLGLVAFLLISGFVGLIIGIVLAVAVALVLKRLFCSEYEVTRVAATAATTAAALDGDAAAAATEKGTSAPAGEKTKAAPASAETGPAKAKAPAESTSGKTASSEPAAAKTAKPAAETAKPAAAAPKKTASTGPEFLDKPRGGKGDDLKQIKGVGPKFETLLNTQGIWHFDQIASWKKADIAVVDAKLEGFHGRIERDDWVTQAKTLAKGGQTAFSKKVKKGGVS